jgi:hypothetical protein
MNEKKVKIFQKVPRGTLESFFGLDFFLKILDNEEKNRNLLHENYQHY